MVGTGGSENEKIIKVSRNWTLMRIFILTKWILVLILWFCIMFWSYTSLCLNTTQMEI
jgi:hypothetical protein